MRSQDAAVGSRSLQSAPEECFDFWRRTLSEAEYQESPAAQASAQLPGAIARRPADAELAGALAAQSAALGLTVRDIVHGAFAVWLHRHTSQRDLLFVVAVDAEAGDARSVVPVRVALGPGTRFGVIARQCAAAAQGTARHALPVDVLAHEIFGSVYPAPIRAAISVSGPDAGPRAAGQPAEVWTGADAFDLSLEVEISGGDIRLNLACRPGNSDAAMADRLAERFEQVLHQAAAGPDARAGEFGIVTAAEAALLADAGAGPARPFGLTTIPERFGRHVRRDPGDVAVTCGEAEVSYAELDRRANRLARFLRQKGVRTEDRCAILQERSIAAVVSILAVLKAGGAYVPVDPKTPALRLAALLRDAEVKVILTDNRSAGAVPEGDHTVVQVARDAEAIARCRDTDPSVTLSAANLAYAIYTSGSTGESKGVLVEHGAVTHFADMAEEFFMTSAADRIAQCASLWFDVSVFEIFGAILTGASLHIASDETKATPGELQRLFRARQISVLMSTPVLLEFLDPDELPDLRVMSIGGEPFSGPLTTRWNKGRRFINGYGPAEATVEVVGKVCEGAWDAGPPIGRPLANHRAYVVDQHLRQVPVGVAGELCVGGPGLARGYLGRPGLTGEVFVPDPFSSAAGDRLYRTGDLVRWLPGGDLEYLGRLDRQVKIRGMRVELAEVESALGRHPAVRRAAAVTVDDKGDVKLVAFVAAPTTLSPADVVAAAAAWLPAYMLPTDVIVREDIPLTDSGKVDSLALTQLLAHMRPGCAEEPPSAGRQPRSDAERRVAGIVSEVVGATSFAADEDIFAIGANSLQVLRVLSRVRSEFGVGVTPQQFFENPTVSGIAAALTMELAATGAA